MHREVIDVESGLLKSAQVSEDGCSEEHDEIPLRHEHHLSLDVEAVVNLLSHQILFIIHITAITTALTTTSILNNMTRLH